MIDFSNVINFFKSPLAYIVHNSKDYKTVESELEKLSNSYNSISGIIKNTKNQITKTQDLLSKKQDPEAIFAKVSVKKYFEKEFEIWKENAMNDEIIQAKKTLELQVDDLEKNYTKKVSDLKISFDKQIEQNEKEKQEYLNSIKPKICADSMSLAVNLFMKSSTKMQELPISYYDFKNHQFYYTHATSKLFNLDLQNGEKLTLRKLIKYIREDNLEENGKTLDELKNSKLADLKGYAGIFLAIKEGEPLDHYYVNDAKSNGKFNSFKLSTVPLYCGDEIAGAGIFFEDNRFSFKRKSIDRLIENTLKTFQSFSNRNTPVQKGYNE
jgi:hypothetical protein